MYKIKCDDSGFIFTLPYSSTSHSRLLLQVNTLFKKMAPITGNRAAWIPKENATIEVGPGPTPEPAENEVVIEVAYAAVNPTDWKV